ncbi:flavodoxin family protein / radical SAM domain-containing protein [Artemisia annua]|uniref:tRNA 4-demethylwyosine synthase (AdoMet-dependent) n=1 Tax=Artemisia annua TaxID=35608 RepID=A0A2U1NCI5_ARTAN|nr:flavodoxin family protein / radical SAM domain-containing protein [Artemisia annua]
MPTTTVTTHLTLLTILSAATLYCLYKSHSLRKPKHPKIKKPLNPNPNTPLNPKPTKTPKIFYISETNTSKNLAKHLYKILKTNNLKFDLINPETYEPEDLHSEDLVLIIASTWQDGLSPSNGVFLSNWLNESVSDFRVGSLLLKGVKFGVFGVGSRSYGEERFNKVGRGFSSGMKALGAVEILPICEGDVDEGDLDEVFEKWCEDVVRVLKSGIVDLEDIAGKAPTKKDLEKGAGMRNGKKNGVKEMVTPVIRASLTKQGYKIIGSHSGVKICRWTKSQLRGRGGCYKHSFYGIESHSYGLSLPICASISNGVKATNSVCISYRRDQGMQNLEWALRCRKPIMAHNSRMLLRMLTWCMEATPSLACANKCVFCWRHHTNPVGKSWQWQMDDPLMIVNSALDQHKKMIKQMKGVPGVTAERLSEGLSPRHCALSLVGEPIMYPEINTLVDELHQRRISTFLVTNAQFPEKIISLKPITQVGMPAFHFALLYVSVDAANKDSMKAIDRPLFGDFWERFVDSLKALKDKQQRTVYRLTLVKGWNTEEVDAYSRLFSIGNPDFVEIKGVTYCGTSATSKLTMENVPWHADVKEFSEALAQKSNGEYEVACEHVHSCCVLLAKVDKFKVDGQWHTWIDYEKFHDLVASGKPFDSNDYMALTPSWAVYGANEGGFDPDQARYKKERNHKTKG